MRHSFLSQLLIVFCYLPSADLQIYHVANVYQAGVEGQLHSLAAIQMAESDLRKRQIVNDNVTFIYHQANFSLENEAGATQALIQLLCNYDIDAIIGPYQGYNMAQLALTATLMNISVIGHVSTLDSLSDKTKYPVLARVSSTLTSIGKAISAFLLNHNWTNIAIITATPASTVLDAITNSIAVKIKIAYQYSFASATPSKAEMVSVLQQLKVSARIVIVCLTVNPWDSRNFMITAMQQNMTDSSFVYILPYPVQNTAYQLYPWESSTGSDNFSVSDADAKKAFQYSFVIQPYGSDKMSIDTANENIDRFARQQPSLVQQGIFNESIQLAIYRPNLYAAMYLYGMALNTCLSLGNESLTRSGRVMLSCFKYQSFTALTGAMGTDDNADRSSLFSVQSFDPNKGYNEAYRISPQVHVCGKNESQTGAKQVNVTFPSPDGVDRSSLAITKFICPPLTTTLVEPSWGTDNNKSPPDTPICGFDGSLCVDSTNYGSVAIGLVAAACVGLGVAAYCVYRNRQLKRNQLMNFSWNLERNDIRFAREAATRSKLDSKNSALGSLMSVGGKSFESSNDSEALKNGHFVNGRYKRNLVSIKAVLMVKRMDMKVEDLMILRKIFESNHENLNRFIGICLDSHKHILVVWNHTAKGQLNTLLHDLEIELDYAFKSSILRDIIHGLDYLHGSSLSFHGNLSADNCVITSRWVVLLTDFGLDRIFNNRFATGTLKKTFTIREADENDNNTTEQIETIELTEGSKEKDIYDFAEILYRVIVREELPETLLEAIEVLQLLVKKGPFLKEKTEVGNYSVPLVQLFKECRSNVPHTRPTITAVKAVVQSCSYSTKNLLDHMFGLMEKYANSLEGIVSERTALLQEERRRADSLLYQMLPRTVADALKRGESVLPEMYDSATIYFSDIVGFTTICSDSSPIQVVDMLNSLYNQFDAIINAHDCYKVETIGDAYLVVSGVPKRNGDKHVTEVCDMSIEIMDFVSEKFIIPHMKDRKMAIRIGVHSGTVAAGVIGLSMPRYCLFGDTVNVASRMESHGVPLKIHLSWSTAALLQSLPHYQVAPRGETFIKGKGICLTYWLDGKAGHRGRVNYQDNNNPHSKATMFSDYNNRIKVHNFIQYMWQLYRMKLF